MFLRRREIALRGGNGYSAARVPEMPKAFTGFEREKKETFDRGIRCSVVNKRVREKRDIADVPVLGIWLLGRHSLDKLYI